MLREAEKDLAITEGMSCFERDYEDRADYLTPKVIYDLISMYKSGQQITLEKLIKVTRQNRSCFEPDFRGYSENHFAFGFFERAYTMLGNVPPPETQQAG